MYEFSASALGTFVFFCCFSADFFGDAGEDPVERVSAVLLHAT